MRKILISAGLILIAAGFLLPWLSKIPLGKLPGDIVIKKPGITFYFPITTMLIISIAISLIVFLLKK